MAAARLIGPVGGVTRASPASAARFPAHRLRRNRDFVLLQVGRLFSSFGSNMSRLAYPLLALAVTGSAADAGYVSAVIFAPMLVFNLLAGVAADRFERRRLMITSDVVAALALAILAAAVAARSAHLWLILAVAAVDSVAGVFFRAGQSGAFRAVVPLPQIVAATSVVQARLSIVRLGAAPLGGALFAVTRALPFVADAMSYAFSTGSLLLMRARFQESRELDRAPLRRQLADGISFFLQIPFLRTTMLMVAVSNFSVTGIELAVIVLAKRDGLPGAAVGGFIALTGATTLLGSVASPLLRRLLPMRRILLAEYWAAVAYAAFVLWPSVYVLAAAFAAQAFCFPNTDSAVAAYSYALIPDP
ncbi:MAG TPA: MFS transporter [Acidothermaceae bacterium]